MLNLIKFCDYDADGYGTEVSCLIAVNAELTNGDKQKLQNIVYEIQDECEDWDFDGVVAEACEKYFKPMNIEYHFIGVDVEIEV